MTAGYKAAGAGLMILGVAAGFMAAGHMDGGSPLSVLIMLVLAAMGLLVSGVSLIGSALKIEELEDDVIQLEKLARLNGKQVYNPNDQKVDYFFPSKEAQK